MGQTRRGRAAIRQGCRSPGAAAAAGRSPAAAPGSTTIDNAAVRIMTSWIACAGSTNTRKSGAASTAKPNPLAACNAAATAVVAASPAQPSKVTRQLSSGSRGSVRQGAAPRGQRRTADGERAGNRLDPVAAAEPGDECMSQGGVGKINAMASLTMPASPAGAVAQPSAPQVWLSQACISVSWSPRPCAGTAMRTRTGNCRSATCRACFALRVI